MVSRFRLSVAQSLGMVVPSKPPRASYRTAWKRADFTSCRWLTALFTASQNGGRYRCWDRRCWIIGRPRGRQTGSRREVRGATGRTRHPAKGAERAVLQGVAEVLQQQHRSWRIAKMVSSDRPPTPRVSRSGKACIYSQDSFRARIAGRTGPSKPCRGGRQPPPRRRGQASRPWRAKAS